ncbi:MAG: sulfatase-like hydrolase/transferase [Planctomycetota bacterium]
MLAAVSRSSTIARARCRDRGIAGPRTIPGLAGLVVVGLALAGTGCGGAASGGELQGAVLILLDTVRADHVSSYGHWRETSPHFDRLAAKGVRFEHVVAPAPWTLPSVAGLLAGEYPARLFPDRAQPMLARSLAERFREAGFTTAAVTEGAFVSKAYGFDRGFSHWAEQEGAVVVRDPGESEAASEHGEIERTFALAGEWLTEHRDERFFLFIHTYEPHTPYTNRDFVAGMDPGKVGPIFPTELIFRLQSGQQELSKAEVEYVKGLYDGGILTSDRYVGAFLDLLDRLGLGDRTLVLVTSDHGEELDDHYPASTGDHGHSLRDPLLEVPLVIYHPSRRFKLSLVTPQARLIDIMPTVAELLGVDTGRLLDGRSLVPMMEGLETEDRLAIAGHTKRGPARSCLRYQGFKYIETLGPETRQPPLRPVPDPRQLYELTSDPGEHTNLAESHAHAGRVLSGILHEELDRISQPWELELRPADEAHRKRLESLGYIKR